MIWTAITYSVSKERIECEVFEAPMDFHEAYSTVNYKSKNIILSLIKGNHEGSAYIPKLELKLTRSSYRGEF